MRSNIRFEEAVNKLAAFSRRMESNAIGLGVELGEGVGVDVGSIGKENRLVVVSGISTKKKDCCRQTMRKEKSCEARYGINHVGLRNILLKG